MESFWQRSLGTPSMQSGSHTHTHTQSKEVYICLAFTFCTFSFCTCFLNWIFFFHFCKHSAAVGKLCLNMEIHKQTAFSPCFFYKKGSVRLSSKFISALGFSAADFRMLPTLCQESVCFRLIQNGKILSKDVWFSVLLCSHLALTSAASGKYFLFAVFLLNSKIKVSCLRN